MLETPRLLIRQWQDSDRAPFAAMNADPEVMRYFPAPLTAEETEAMMERNRGHFARHGFGFWAVELKGTGELAGFIGLGVVPFEAYFTPCVEIGWRLRPQFWNQGLATEGASAVLQYGRDVLGLHEIVAFTAAVNLASRRVMEKLGMMRDGEFEHPGLPAGHWLRPHVLYRWHAGEVGASSIGGDTRD